MHVVSHLLCYKVIYVNSVFWLLFSGYARVFLALLSFYYMPTDYGIASFCYLLSGFLDAFDGHAARMLNQSECNCLSHRLSGNLYFNILNLTISTKLLPFSKLVTH